MIGGPVASLALQPRGASPAGPAARGSNFLPVPGSSVVVFSASTRYGVYTIRRGRTRGPRGETIEYSSPRLGITGSIGVPSPLPTGAYLRVTGGGASPPEKVREVYGRASRHVVRVQGILKDGSRQDAILKHGWFVFTQDLGHAEVLAMVGFDRRGRMIARTPGRIL